MKKLSNLTIKNIFRKNFNINTSKKKKKNQSKLVRSQKLKCNKNKSKKYTKKKKKIQKGNSQLIIDSRDVLISQENNIESILQLQESSCLTKIREKLDHLEHFFTPKVIEEIKKNDEIKIMNELFNIYHRGKEYYQNKIIKLQNKIDENNLIKIISLAIILGNFVLFCLDKNNKREHITFDDIQLPSKILFILTYLSNIFIMTSNPTARSNFLTSNYYLTFSKLNSLHSILGLLDSSISYNTTPQSIGVESIQKILEYEPTKQFNIHNIILLGLTIIISIISIIITKKIIIPIFDKKEDNYNLIVENNLVGLTQDTINKCCFNVDTEILLNKNQKHQVKKVDKLCDEIKIEKEKSNLKYNPETCDNLKSLLKGDKMPKCE